MIVCAKFVKSYHKIVIIKVMIDSGTTYNSIIFSIASAASEEFTTGDVDKVQKVGRLSCAIYMCL